MGLLTACEEAPRGVASVFVAVFATLSAAFAARMSEVCGAKPGFFCREVITRTNDRTLAELADHLLAPALSIVAIVIGAFVVNRIVTRGVRRALRTLHSGAVRERIGALRRRAPNALLQTDELSLRADQRPCEGRHQGRRRHPLEAP
jgi:hypothetical protein